MDPPSSSLSPALEEALRLLKRSREELEALVGSADPDHDAADSARLIRRLLAEADEEEALSAMLGIDLSRAYAIHEPVRFYLGLDEHLRRSEEIHRHLQAARRRELCRDGQ